MIFCFNFNYKLTKKQLKMIESNIKNYCDKIGCKEFNFCISYVRGENYFLDLELINIEESEEINVDIVNLIDFYLSEFEQNNDKKIF